MTEKEFQQKLMDLVGAWLAVDTTDRHVNKAELVVLFHSRAVEIERELLDEFRRLAAIEKGE